MGRGHLVITWIANRTAANPIQSRPRREKIVGILRRLFGRKYNPSLDELDTPTREEEPDQGIYTGTATIVVYDLVSLKHRLNDDVDWWADPREELVEINRRNLLIIGLGSDGFYDVDVSDEVDFPKCYSLSFQSGNVFIGAGEMLTGGGDEPEKRYGGMFLNFAPGDYRIGISRTGDRLRIGISQADAFSNDVLEPIQI